MMGDFNLLGHSFSYKQEASAIPGGMIQFKLAASKTGAKSEEIMPNWYTADWDAMKRKLTETD
jgi:hypothetical protein